jgi:hypothetical protein
MTTIKELYPDLAWEHVRALALFIATERNAVVDVNKVYSREWWGLACLACNVVRDRVRDVAESVEYPWLEYIPERGLAYTAVVDRAPLRIQPDVPEIRESMPGERLLMRGGQEAHASQGTLPCQETLFPLSKDDGSLVLRLEVTHPRAMPVEQIVMYLFDENSGVALDKEVVYQAAAAVSDQSDAAASGVPVMPDGQQTELPTNVISLARPAQDVDLTGQFVFHEDIKKEAKDGAE